VIPLVFLAALGATPNAFDLAEWHNLEMSRVRFGQRRAWEITDPGDNRNYWTYGVAQDVFLILSGDLRGYDSRTGKLRWRVPNPIGRGYPSAIRNLGDRILCSFWDGGQATLAALDPKNGVTLWKKDYPSFAGQMHAVGDDLVIAVQVPEGPQSTGQLDHLMIINGRDGSIRAELSPNDEAANRAALRKVAPSMVDQVILFSGSITRNGVALPTPTALDNAWVVGDHLVTQYALDDFPMDMGAMAGFATFRCFRLGDLGKTNAPDRWKERGNGRQYHQANCTYFGGVLGGSQDQVMALFTRQYVERGDIRRASTPVRIPLEGDMVVRPIEGLPKDVSGSWPIPGGHILWGPEQTSYVWRGKQLVRQTSPKGAGWYAIQPLMDGLIYRRDPTQGDPVYRFRLEPFRTR
jgi:hypothetical protein